MENKNLFESVLVPLDGSALAETVLSPLESMLKKDGGSLILLRALEYPDLNTDLYREFVSDLQEKAEQHLSTKQHELRERGLSAKTMVSLEDPAKAILETAAEQGCSLIAMTSHGHSGISHWAFGSVTEKILRNTTLPVLVVRPEKEGKENVKSPARNLLVPLDGSAFSEHALPAATQFARNNDMTLVLLHVFEYPPTDPRWKECDFPLQSVEKDLRARKIPVRTEYRKGKPAEQILRYCSQEPVNAIAMSTHGRSAIPRWVFGSVCEKVLRGSSTPLLVVRTMPEKTREHVSALGRYIIA